MTDRAPCTVELFSFPQDNAQAIADVFETFGLIDQEQGTDTYGTAAYVLANHNYEDEELSVGLDAEIADQLADLGCEAAVSQDAKYEYDGTQHIICPDLDPRVWSGLCTQGGSLTVEASAVAEVVRNSKAADVSLDDRYDALLDDLAHLTGEPWRARLDALRKARTEATAAAVLNAQRPLHVPDDPTGIVLQ